MDTQTKLEFKKPKNPSEVALDTDESSRMDVCIQNNSFQQRLVHVYIRYLGINLDILLAGAENLESRVFECENPGELRIRFLNSTKTLKPLINLVRTDGSYLLEYDLLEKNYVYNSVRKL